MAFCLKPLLTIAFVVAAVHIYCANGAPPPPTSVELEANRQTNRFLCFVEFKKFIEMFKQQNENVGKVKKNITSKDLRDTNAYKDFLNTTAYKKFQNAYKEFQKKELQKKGINNKISDDDLKDLLEQIDEMAATLVVQAETAVGTVRLQVPYSFKVDVGNNKTTTYFETYFEKKRLETKALFAKQEGNELLQKHLTAVNPKLFEIVYENFLKISTYTSISVISQHESIKSLAEFLENYESTEAANDLMKMCKTKFEENKKAKKEAYKCTRGICEDLHENDGERSGALCRLCRCCCCCCLCMPIWCTCVAVTASVEGCQFHKLNNKQKEELITIYDQMKTHIWKKKKNEPVRGRFRK